MKIGSHVSNNGLMMLEGSVKEALSYGANALMVYLGAIIIMGIAFLIFINECERR